MGYRISQIVKLLPGTIVYEVNMLSIRQLYLIGTHPLYNDYYLFSVTGDPGKILSLYIKNPIYDDFSNYVLDEKQAKELQIQLCEEYLQNKKDHNKSM